MIQWYLNLNIPKISTSESAPKSENSERCWRSGLATRIEISWEMVGILDSRKGRSKREVREVKGVNSDVRWPHKGVRTSPAIWRYCNHDRGDRAKNFMISSGIIGACNLSDSVYFS